MDIALRALLNPGDAVLYHEPCYVSYMPGVVMAHGEAIPVAWLRALRVARFAQCWVVHCGLSRSLTVFEAPAGVDRLVLVDTLARGEA